MCHLHNKIFISANFEPKTSGQKFRFSANFWLKIDWNDNFIIRPHCNLIHHHSCISESSIRLRGWHNNQILRLCLWYMESITTSIELYQWYHYFCRWKMGCKGIWWELEWNDWNGTQGRSWRHCSRSYFEYRSSILCWFFTFTPWKYVRRSFRAFLFIPMRKSRLDKL